MNTHINNSQFLAFCLNRKTQKGKHGMFYCLLPAFFSMFFLLLLLSPLFAEGLKPTPLFMDFYGSIEGASAGDVITAYSSRGVICGRFTVTQKGEYGFMHIYGDDPTTNSIIEGALPNEPITFKLNDATLKPQQDPVFWIGDGQRQRVDFRR